MSTHLKTYLNEIIYRTNMLLDQGNNASFDEIHKNAQDKTIVQWLSDKGSDMSILLSDVMTEDREAVEEAIANESVVFEGREERKLGVKKNGLCLLIMLAVRALAVNA